MTIHRAAPQPHVRRRAPVWARILVSGFVLWMAAVVITFATGNANLVPTVILLGSFLVPVTFVVYAFGRGDGVVLTAQRIFTAFIVGGALGVLGATVLEVALLRQPSSLSYVGVGLIEEAVKLAALWLLVRHLSRCGQLGTVAPGRRRRRGDPGPLLVADAHRSPLAIETARAAGRRSQVAPRPRRMTGPLVETWAKAAHPRRWRALAVSQLAAFMALLDVSIVNVALPSIQRDLNAAPATAQWVVSGYAFAFALVPAGRLGDSVGTRRMFLLGLLLFVLTSA